MTKQSFLRATPKVDNDRTTRRLRELATREAAVAKERLAIRTSATRSFSVAMTRLAEAQARWERAEVEVKRTKAKAVKDLLGSGLQLDDVAELLELSKKEVTGLSATTTGRPTKARGPSIGPTSDTIASVVALERPGAHL